MGLPALLCCFSFFGEKGISAPFGECENDANGMLAFPLKFIQDFHHMSNQAIYDNILKQQHFVDARALALSDSMLKVLSDTVEIIVGRIVELQAKMLKADDWQLETLTRKSKYLEAQAEAINSILSGVYEQQISPLMQDGINDASQYSYKQTNTVLSNTLTIEIPSPKLSLTQILAWQQATTVDGLLLSEWLRRMESKSAELIKQNARQAMLESLSVQKTASLMRQNGIEASRPAVMALSRTSLMTMSNLARETSIKEFAQDLDYQWMYCATLDNRNCLICGKDDGRVFEQNESRPSLPRHINCRCLFVPFFEEFPPLTRPGTKWDSRQVNHRDGSTSTKFTVNSSSLTQENYNTWLRRQLETDPQFVRSILGKTRYELYSQGKLDISKMVSDNRILNLAEL